MLMDCLSAGRGVSLPGQATGASKQAARIVGAYAGVRQQFGMSIGRFEGIEEPLARIASFTYMLDAARTFTCGAVDEGAKPSVVSAILKYVGTEMARKVAQDTMDVMGGAALCRGPHNLVSQGPSAAAIGITVEGANILTRTLIMFGQGAIRCHPYAQKELQSLGDHDSRAFLEALQHHITFFLGNITKTLAYFFTGGPTNGSGPAHPALNRAFRRVRWASTQFAVLVDMALITLGSKLKQKGHLSGRYADVLSWIFMGLATLRRFEADGSNKEDVPLVRWSVEYCLWQAQLAIEGIWDNFPVPALPTFFGTMARLNPLGHSPKDELTSEVARILTTPGPARDRLTGGLYHPTPDEPLGRLEEAFRLCAAAGVVETKVRKAIKRRQMPGGRMEKILEAGIAANVITADEAMTWKKAQDARRQVIEVDSFDLTEYLANK
jgi:acyl-CoA dehydrogenase